MSEVIALVVTTTATLLGVVLGIRSLSARARLRARLQQELSIWAAMPEGDAKKALEAQVERLGLRLVRLEVREAHTDPRAVALVLILSALGFSSARFFTLPFAASAPSESVRWVFTLLAVVQVVGPLATSLGEVIRVKRARSLDTPSDDAG